MANEQLEVRISGRDFGISLKGYNPQANAQIRAQLAGETDLLVLLRAYLDVVHQKCELESRLAQLNEKLDSMLKSPRYSLRESPQILQDLQDLPKDPIDSGAESTKARAPESTESTALESAALDSRTPESVKDSTKTPAPKHAQVPQVPLARLDSLDSTPADSLADSPADSPAQANPVALDLFSALESHAESAL